MNDNLRELARLLHEGRRRSEQTSLQRRTPSPEAVPYLRRARDGLRLIVEAEPGNVEAWRLLSQADEMLLDYGNARLAIERVLALEPRRDRRDLKRLALLREYETWWSGLRLTPAQLAELGDYLDRSLATAPCNRTLRHTRTWFEQSGFARPDQIIQALEDCGGYCDCGVLFNVTF